MRYSGGHFELEVESMGVRCGRGCRIGCVRYPSAPAAWWAFAVRGPAIRPAFGPVIPQAVAARSARAPAEEFRAADFQAGFPAAARSVAPAGSADLPWVRSASHRYSSLTRPDGLTAPAKRCSLERLSASRPSREPAWCCCGSCRFANNRVTACRRYSRHATLCGTDVRSPPRAATGFPEPAQKSR
jgi:hypothetical protein